MARIERQRPSGQQMPRLEPRVEQLRVGHDTEQTPELTDSQSPGVTDSQTPEVPESSGGRGPKHTQMVRKEARLRPDQADALAALRRHVAGQRQQRVEPITDNTLLRVAVDLLLTRAEDLAGDTEDALRDSVTHRLPE